MRYLYCTIILLSGTIAFSQSDQAFREYAVKSFPTLKELLAIPNDAHYLEDIEKNVKWCETQFANRGFDLQRLETPEAPLLLASRKCNNPDAQTVLVYLQVDGQPVDSSFWYQDNPYTATLKKRGEEGGWKTIDWDLISNTSFDDEWRIFARSTSDSKGEVMMFLTALDMMKDNGDEQPFHMKVIMDFEEELGSPNLPEAVDNYKSDLTSDMLIIFDGPMHASNNPTLSFGARGISTVTLTVYGPFFPQHSGHYGNYLPNPAVRLSQLIASMKDRDGRVTIPGWYDGISISDEVKQILSRIPDDERQIRLSKGIANPDKVAPNYQESLQYPSLNVRGMLAGWVGDEVRTIIPAIATAEIDVRLVIESDPERLINLLRNHIKEEGYHLTEGRPTSQERAMNDRICSFRYNTSYLAFRTDFDTPVGKWLDRSIRKAHGEEPIKIRTSGGSIPISPFVNKLGIPAVSVPTVNRDNNQHSPNENIRLGNYVDGIKTIYWIMKSEIE